ncbi:FeoB-associated Cys-rich membrane protein [Longibaculum muris]|uniref:FeoB-associated Cys-rich membrane protein n=1 Tax=Longibaculum muris TaxID=1796628 RepID=UPI0022E5CF0F|nr:FeoB-associated Cys-rich membrane protein [Longibaculum muris]
MMNWILNNLSTIIVAAILLIIVIMIIKHQIQTRHTCSSGCGGCPMAGKCQTHKK